jgi:hypothetical protein
MLMFPNNKVRKPLIVSFIISGIILVLTTLCVVGVLGPNLANMYTYPEIHMLRSIDGMVVNYQWANFFSLIWIFDIFILLCTAIHFCNYLIDIKRKYIIPIIILALSVLFLNDYMEVVKTLYIPFSCIFIILIVIFNIKILIKKK